MPGRMAGRMPGRMPGWMPVPDALPATLAPTRHRVRVISSTRRTSIQRHCQQGLCTFDMENYVTFSRPTSNRFNLVCDNQHLQRLLGTFTMTGLLLGSLIGGRCGDYFGRKKVLYAACLVISLALGTASFSISYTMFAVCHLIYRQDRMYE